jgi:hypothetical protein
MHLNAPFLFLDTTVETLRLIFFAPRGTTWYNVVPRGTKWHQMVPLGITWRQMVPLGITWRQMEPLSYAKFFFDFF